MAGEPGRLYGVLNDPELFLCETETKGIEDKQCLYRLRLVSRCHRHYGLRQLGITDGLPQKAGKGIPTAQTAVIDSINDMVVCLGLRMNCDLTPTDPEGEQVWIIRLYGGPGQAEIESQFFATDIQK